VKLFGEHGIDVPDLAPVTRTAILGFHSTGQDPLNWWQRLHAIGERTAYRPLLTDSDLAESLDRPTTDAVPARATELDVAEVLELALWVYGAFMVACPGWLAGAVIVGGKSDGVCPGFG
jgi:hypothetical protein